MTYACHNRKDFAKTIRVQAGWNQKMNERYMVRIPFVMNRECQYTREPLGQADAGCLGCRHRSTNPPQGTNRT